MNELTIDGHRVVRVRTEPRCKCCRGDVRDVVERWLLLRKLRGCTEAGERVSLEWMVVQSRPRLGVEISADSFENHRSKHMEIVVDGSASVPAVTDSAERLREMIDSGEIGSGTAPPHHELLDAVVRIGMLGVLADPSKVTVDHAIAAAKELGRLNVDAAKVEVLRALGGATAGALGARVAPEVKAIDAEILVETEDA